MKSTVIFGSPRKSGNTACLLKPFLNELEKENVEINYFDVYELSIAGCRACLACQKDTKNINCVIRDDMQPVFKSVEESELIVIAAPIYAWSVPAPVKAVIDRLVYSTCKYYGDDPHGPALMRGKRLALISTCGYPVGHGADLYEEAMKRYCKHCGLEYAGIVCERQRNLKEDFMSEDKEQRVREFAVQLIGKAAED